MKNCELITKAIGFLPAYNRTPNEQQIMDLLTAFLLSNAVAESSKFNLLDYVGKEPLRPNLTGVYYTEGKKVATDAWVLICLAEQYPYELEGKIIDKKGQVIGAKYVDYMRVKPSDCTTEVRLDFARIAEMAKEAKLYKRIGDGGGVAVKVAENTFYAPDLLQKIAVFAKHIGTDKLMINDMSKGFVECGESWALIMNILENDGLKVWEM